MKPNRSLNYVVFAALMISTALGYQSLWGLLFLYWTILNFRTGRAFLLSEVSRDQDPILFWLIQIAWGVLGLWLVAQDFIQY